jgi:flavin reductase (DIM6/NTAB) family NADH-FMN oxidoreductase RutF
MPNGAQRPKNSMRLLTVYSVRLNVVTVSLTIEPKNLRTDCLQILGRVPNPVAIVTLWVDGRPWGVTVSSFLSVTLDPPKILVSLFSNTLAATEILESGRFGVNLLNVDQQLAAELSSKPGTPKFLEAFCSTSRVPPVGDVLPVDSPRLDGADYFGCEVDQSVAVDDHILLVGRVMEAQSARNVRDSLVYVNRSYTRIADHASHSESPVGSNR